jgi:hypothetical protein
MFWPAFLGIGLIFTLLSFYPFWSDKVGHFIEYQAAD